MDQQTAERIDAAIGVTGLLLRAGAYALVGGVASRYACGQVILTGLFVGDVAASALGAALADRLHVLQRLSELLLLGLIFLWVRGDLVWPEQQAMKALLGLSALGVFAGRAGGGVLTRFGPSENGWA